MTRCYESASQRATAWRHVRAIAALPFMNSVVIPTALLALTGRGAALHPPTVSGAAASVLGGALLAGGFALVAHAIALFVRVGHGTLAPWDPTRRIVTEGAYRHARNPMKAGLFLVLLGEAALFRSLPLLGWFAVFALVNAVYIRVSEEPGLRRRFGPAYEDYCARVPRWFPTFGARRRRERQGEPA